MTIRVTTRTRRRCASRVSIFATACLASLWWPLVLTTNYDSLFIDDFNRHWMPLGTRRRDAGEDFESMIVLGRSHADCQTLLASLNVPSRPILWALQGSFRNSANGVSLSDEIVVGYEQYRNATFNNPGFRAAFTEVFRNRSLFFVGSNLSEDYFRGLFGESLTRLGPSQHTHVALVNRRQVDSREVDPWFLHTRLNIVVLTYEDRPRVKRFSGFAPCLRDIVTFLTRPPLRTQQFVFEPTGPARERKATARHPRCIDFTRDELPSHGPAHWVLVSAGLDRRTRQPKPSGIAGFARHDRYRKVPGCHSVWCRNDAEGAGLLLGVARRRDAGDSSWRARDLRTVEDVVVEALRAATVDKSCKTLSMMLLGAGGKRTWPRVYSLVQMLRGLRTFYVTHPEARRLQLRIHDTPETSAQAAHHWDASIWTAIASRRLDHEEILNCGALRCYVEQAGSDSNRRVPMYLTDDKTVSQVAMFFKIDVKSRRWRVDIVPRPGPDYEPFELARHGDQTLKQFAIVPGSTIRFIRD